MLRVAPAISPATPALAISPSTPGSEVSGLEPITKAWELPPRPKPGRKPADDTPPTKRKAQNRAAQRAFRERRAARVGELEEEKQLILDKQESEEDQRRRERDQERQIYQQTVTEWRLRSEHWERVAGDETRRRIEEERLRLDERRIRIDEDRRYQDQIRSLRRELEMLRMSTSWNAQEGSFSAKVSSWSHTTPIAKDYPILPLPSPQHLQPLECKDCGTNGRCECIEQVLKALPKPVVQESSVPKNDVDMFDAMEIDFTAKFARKNNSVIPVVSENESLMSIGTPVSSSEHCGFCTDDANCVCRANMLATSTLENEPTSLVSPPDSTYGERTSYIAHKPQPVEPSPFTTGPGTCSACISDPERRKFCQTLAGLMPPPPLPRLNSMNISGGGDVSTGKFSCADAYTQLSKDPQFEVKKDSISFLQQLKTRPSQSMRDSQATEPKECSLYEVDCASVLAAMKGSGGTFDKRNTSN